MIHECILNAEVPFFGTFFKYFLYFSSIPFHVLLPGHNFSR